MRGETFLQKSFPPHPPSKNSHKYGLWGQALMSRTFLPMPQPAPQIFDVSRNRHRYPSSGGLL